MIRKGSATSAALSARDDPGPLLGPDGPRPVTGPVFGDRARRAGLLWTVAVVAFSALVGLVVHTPRDYLLAMPLTSGLLTAPAIVAACTAARRVEGPWRRFWGWYVAGAVALYHMGAAIFAWAVHDRAVYLWLMGVALVAVVVCDARAIELMVKTRSGVRSRSVDLVESALAIVAIGAPAVVLYGSQILSVPYAWFSVTSVVCLSLFISVLWCSVVLFVRSPAGQRRSEGVGLVWAAAAVIDAIAQIEHAMSGLTLPAAPVLALNALSMGLLLLLPLHSRHDHARGLERLPPLAQVRTGTVIAAVTFGALPLLAGAVLLRGSSSAAVHTALVALGALVALSAARQLLTFAETRRLYAQVERSAEDRRALLAAVLESMDAERRRVALQLHEQAASSYAALASLVPVDEGLTRVRGEGGARLRSVPAPRVSHVLTERLAAQAESLRELIGAIRPMSVEGGGLAPILQAYVDSLDDAVRPAVTQVVVADGLVLDWLTETVALRIVQEAVRNTCRHADASVLRISLEVEDAVAVLRVGDDGSGFAVDGLVVESGIATMRRFLSFCGGSLRIRSEPGRGTMVVAHLGGSVPEVPAPPRLRPV